MNRQRRGQRGVALALVAVFLVVLVGITAIGIDLGRLAHTANEVQTVADSAARAGAKTLFDNSGTPGMGIAAAHVISSDNFVDGSAPPNGDVLVDEGSYNPVSGQFACCTSNSPCCTGGSWRGLTCVPSSSCTRRTAVLAIPHTTVENLFAGVFDFMSGGRFTDTAAAGRPNQHTTVERLAVAHASGPGAGCQVPPECAATPTNWGCYCDHGVAPCLPIAASVCDFPDGCTANNCLPHLTVSNNTNDTACWTGFTGNADANDVRNFMSSGPCQPPNPGPIGTQTISSTISLNNGINTNGNNNTFDLAQCLAGLSAAPQNQPQGCALDSDGRIIPGARGTVFTIPIFDKGTTCPQQCNQSGPVVGFATVKVTGFNPGPPRTLSIDAVANITGTENQSGGVCVATDCQVVMAR